MKNLITYLKALWGAWGNLQSSDVRHDCRRSDLRRSPSGLDAKWMLKLVSVLVLIQTVGVGQMWGTTYTTGTIPTGWSASGGSMTMNTISWTYSSATYLGVTSGKIQVGSSKKPQTSNWTIQTAISNFGSGKKVTAISITAYTTATSATYDISAGGSTVKSGSLSTSSSTYTASSLNVSSGDIVITMKGSSSSKAMYLSAISVTYEDAASCTTPPTVTASSNSSVTATTATVTCSSGISSLGSAGCTISGYGFVIGTSSNPSIGGSGVTKHEVGTSYTTTGTSFYKDLTGLTAETTYYVRPYATNGNGTAYGTQTSFTTPALPKYTVTYNAGTGTCGTASWTQPSYGASTTLPSATPPATCTGGWSFAGWCTSSAGSADENSTSPGTILTGSYTPTGNVTLYAIYKRTASGGTTTYTLVDDAADFEDGTYVVAGLASSTYYFMDGNVTANTGLGVEETGLAAASVSDGSFAASSLPSGAIEIDVEDDGEPDGDNHYYFISYTSGGDTYYMDDSGTKQSLTWTTNTTVYTYHPNFTQNAGTDGCVLLSGSGAKVSQNGSTKASFIRNYASGGSFYNDMYFFKKSSGTTYYMTSLVCCTQLASINGSFSFTSVGTTGATANWGWTGATTGISKNILKVYKESDNSLVATIDNISASATSQAITGLDPCTEYYVKLSTVSSGGGYCDGVADQTGASHVTFTTSSYTVTKTGVTNVTAASLSAIPATTCASGFGPITIEAASGYVLPATVTVTGATGSWTQASGSLTISSVTGNVSITITPTAASCASFSFHTGTGDDATVKTTNTTTCFSQVNSSTTWKIDNYVIPADTKFFVGDRGFFYDDNLGSNNSRSAVKTWSQEMFFEYTKAYGDGYRPTVGQATGAIGTLYIWSDNNWNNLHVGFSPQGYVFKLGSANLAMSGSATLDADRYWETSVITLTSTDISGNYQTNLYTGSAGGVASNNTQSTAVNTMGVKTNAGDNWRGTAINDGTDANTRGFFRIDIGDGGTKNWHAHWVPTHRVVFHPNYPGGGGEDQYSVDVSVEETNSSIALASAPSNPTGYTFAGWYDAADGGNHITTARTISAGASANVELWAHWTANTISLTLNKNTEDAGSNNGSGSIDFDATSGTISTAPTRTGYTVEGYYTDAACTAANKVLTNTGAVVNSTVSGYTTSGKWTRATTPTTLYTKWTPNNYTVTWHVGDATSTSTVAYNTDFQDITVGKPAVTNSSLSSCESNYFVGWVTSGGIRTTDGGTVALYNDNKVNATDKITGDVDFYAMFATGSGSETTISLTNTEMIAGRSNNDYSTSYDIDGWTGKYAINKNVDNYALQLGRNTDSSKGAYNSHLTTPTLPSGAYITSITLTPHTSYTTASGRTFYLLSSDNIGYTAASDQGNDYGVGSCASDNAAVTITVTNSPSQCHIWADGTSYFDNISLTYSTASYTNYRTNCAACANQVTVSYSAPGNGNAMTVKKGLLDISNGDALKTCSGSTELTVTLTPASHYTVTNFTATGVTGVTTSNVGNVYTVTIPQDKSGTLTLTPTFTEDAHIAINWNVNGSNLDLSGSAAEGLTWVYSGGDITALPSTPSVPAGCSGTKVFAGWSTKHSDATEEDASFYDDLFTSAGPTGITSAKTYYAVFATSSSNPLAGETMWAEDFSGFSADDTPNTSYGSAHTGTTVYNSGNVTYACTNGGTTTKIYAANLAGGTSPEILVSKSNGQFDVTGIPTGGQTELTLTYKCNKGTTAFEVSSATGTVTVGDASVDGSTYTRTITISQSPSATNSFALTFKQTTSENARLDDISLVVPGSGTMTDYVTLCAPSYTITYNKNTSDPVTNLPSPTSVLQSTGSGTLSSTVPVRATYTFSGWSETTSGAVAYAAGGSITGVTGDKTLYAVWTKTPVEELSLNYSELNKYVGDPAVTLEVTGVTPEGADPSVTWSSSNSSVASVVAATGVVTFGTVGTATITATSTVTGTTTAYCYVTVRNKPTATFVDLIHDGNGTDLSTYYMQNVAGTAIVFPTLDDYATPGDDCDSKHYVFVGWTTSDNNDDPQDHLVASGELEDDQNKVFYAVWADGVEGVSYTKLTTSTFKTSPTKYVIGAIDGDDTFYFYSCAATDANNGNGGCTNAPGTNAPIQFTLSGTANALVATSTEATARYLTPLTAKNFQMSATSKTIQLNDTGTIANPSNDSWTLRFNTSEDYLRWYNSATGNAAYFYEVTAGAAVSYRTSCCTNNVPAPTVIATNTAYTVTLTWAAVDGATGYEVSWNGGAFEAATSPCIKSGLTASTDYIYKVRATYDPLVKCGALVASGSVTTDDVYSVTYSGGAGTGSCSPSGSVAPASYEAGATVTLAPTNSFSLTSNTFAAWVVKDADDNDVPVSNNQFTMPAKNVTVTATWTAVQDKYYDRMHDGTDASHGGIADGEGKYYLVLEGCNYTVPTLTDDDEGDTECHTTHFKLLGWIAQSHLKTDGSGEIKPGEESYIFQGGGTKSATGATYYAVWAIMTE